MLLLTSRDYHAPPLILFHFVHGMRFLLHFPLPLLLILIQSICTPLVNGSSSANEEGTSLSPPINDDLSLEEVQNKLDIAIAEVAQLQQKVDAARKELNEKQKEAQVPFSEYNHSKTEWERRKADLEALQSSRELAELKRKAQEAQENLIKAEEAFSTINKTVNEQEEEFKKIGDEIEKINQKIKDINDTSNKLAIEKATLDTLSAEIETTNTHITNLAAEVTKKTNEVEAYDSKVTAWQTEFDSKGCAMKVKTGECAKPDKFLKEWKGKRKAAQKELNEILASKLTAVNKLTELNNKKTTAEKNIKSLTIDNGMIDRLVAAQTTLREIPEERIKLIEEPLKEAKKGRLAAKEELENAKTAKNETESKVSSYSNEELKKAIDAEKSTKKDFEVKEDNWKPLESELKILQNNFSDLEGKLSQSNQKVSRFSARRDQLKQEQSPKTGGSDPTTIICVVIFSLVLAALVIGMLVFLKRRNKQNKDITTTRLSHSDFPPTEPSVLKFMKEDEVTAQDVSVGEPPKEREKPQKAEFETMNVNDLPTATEFDNFKKKHIQKVIKGDTITFIRHKNNTITMNYETAFGSQTMFHNGSTKSCLNHKEYSLSGAEPDVKKEPNTQRFSSLFDGPISQVEPIKTKIPQTPEEYASFLGRIKQSEENFDDRVLCRVPAGKDESGTGAGSESSGPHHDDHEASRQHDDETQTTGTKVTDTTQNTETKQETGGTGTAAEAPKIPSEKQEEKEGEDSVVAKNPKVVHQGLDLSRSGPETRGTSGIGQNPRPHTQLPRYSRHRIVPTKKWKSHQLIDTLLEIIDYYKHSNTKHPFQMNMGDRRYLIDMVTKKLKDEPALVEKKYGKYTTRVYGDLRGNLSVFLKDSDSLGGVGSKEWDNHKFVFLGNYIDSGAHSLDVVMILLLLKLCFKDNIFLIRGYFELQDVNEKIGFHSMLNREFGDEGSQLFHEINQAFSKMSYGFLLGGGMLMIHSGIPTDDQEFSRNAFKQISREVKLQDPMGHALLVNQPERGLQKFANDRNSDAKRFGEKPLEEYMGTRIRLVARAGQPIDAGFEFFHDRRMVSLFSAIIPSSAGAPNHAAVMIIDEKHRKCWFHKFVVSMTKTEYYRQEDVHKFKSSLHVNNDYHAD